MNIPTDLHMTTAERLRLVADLITEFPEKWDQSAFCPREYREAIMPNPEHYAPPAVAAGHLDDALHFCGTVGCLAGWGVACSPPDLLALHTTARWRAAGSDAFGFSEDLGRALFLDWNEWGLDEDDGPVPFAAVLRALADLPEPRTLADALRLGILYETDEDYDDE